jgi:hypothetical protein
VLAGRAQNLRDGFAGLVVDEDKRYGVGCRCARIHLRCLGIPKQRHLEPEYAALVDNARHADIAAHQLHELLRDRRTQACAAILPRRGLIRLDESLEDVR